MISVRIKLLHDTSPPPLHPRRYFRLQEDMERLKAQHAVSCGLQPITDMW